MAHSLSAKKRIRQNLKRRTHNRGRKAVIKDDVKAFSALVAAGKFDKAAAQLNKVTRSLDRTAAKNTIHRNTASRKRSRLTRRLNAARTAPVPAAPATKPVAR